MPSSVASPGAQPILPATWIEGQGVDSAFDEPEWPDSGRS